MSGRKQNISAALPAERTVEDLGYFSAEQPSAILRTARIAKYQ